jgi:hypothetical protein
VLYLASPTRRLRRVFVVAFRTGRRRLREAPHALTFAALVPRHRADGLVGTSGHRVDLLAVAMGTAVGHGHGSDSPRGVIVLLRCGSRKGGCKNRGRREALPSTSYGQAPRRRFAVTRHLSSAGAQSSCGATARSPRLSRHVAVGSPGVNARRDMLLLTAAENSNGHGTGSHFRQIAGLQPCETIRDAASRHRGVTRERTAARYGA